MLHTSKTRQPYNRVHMQHINLNSLPTNMSTKPEQCGQPHTGILAVTEQYRLNTSSACG